MVANRNALKAYAPQARKDFIRAMTYRAAMFGVTKDGFTQGEERGDLFLIDGKAFPKIVAEQRKRLLARIKDTSFDQVMEAVAYTWFNRFLAIRYMELHGYFDHGYRVLSHPRGEREPEILQQAQHLNLPGLDPKVVIELKLEGDRDEVLYRRILIAQCNDLHNAMPFLFERIDDETELLLPENLLQSDSMVFTLVNGIAESEWDEIEIIGWLYQFYISEKKDQVIGKVVKSEDIPAATQLFTPDWIVKYMVQNSLGAQWLATYPDSPLRATMAYYIEPAEQPPEVQAQLDAITPNSLDPETITLIDPAVGSGHILVEAYDLFRAIYIERGYTPQGAARAILTKNLYGLDIDDRAAQMAGFALLMKARADDRTLFRDPPTLNVISLTDSSGWDAMAIADALIPKGRVELLRLSDQMPEAFAQPTLSVSAEDSGARAAIAGIVALFEGAKTFGSLITVPKAVTESIPALEELLAAPISADLLHRNSQILARERLSALVVQAMTLSRLYDCVLANPPYMGWKNMNEVTRVFATRTFPLSKTDLFSMFMEKTFSMLKPGGTNAQVNMQAWMFLTTFEAFRGWLLSNKSIISLAHLGPRAFGAISGEVVQVAVWVIRSVQSPHFKSTFLRAVDGSEVEKREAIKARRVPRFDIPQIEFTKIPGAPIAYWLSDLYRDAFRKHTPLDSISYLKEGMTTSNNDLFLRLWHEISRDNFTADAANHSDSISSKSKWFPYNKGGGDRRWYGYNTHVVNWWNDGRDVCEYNAAIYGTASKQIRNIPYYFQPSLTWTAISSSGFCVRSCPSGFIFDSKGPSIFELNKDLQYILSVCAAKTSEYFLSGLRASLDYRIAQVGRIPVVDLNPTEDVTVRQLGSSAVLISKFDWDSYEVSWDFAEAPLLRSDSRRETLLASYSSARAQWRELTHRLETIEQDNNRIFIDAYGLVDELDPKVPLNKITLTCNPHYRYSADLTNAQREARLLSDAMRELISYGVGLVMGRYSLAEPGLIYAHAGNAGFDPGRYGPFPADDDGIVPIAEEPWFTDDAAARIEQFLTIAWPRAPINETLATLTDGLTQDGGGEPRAALRAYLAKTFYKDHLQTYRNRPIYWLFSSGKLKSFECLVYLHRYNESTLARMRTAYVTPLMGKMQQRITDLEVEIATSASSAEKARKARERENLVKQLAELRTFDEELRHLADQRIKLDLDDGVKVNYGRFGNLLAAKDKVRGKDDKED